MVEPDRPGAAPSQQLLRGLPRGRPAATPAPRPGHPRRPLPPALPSRLPRCRTASPLLPPSGAVSPPSSPASSARPRQGARRRCPASPPPDPAARRTAPSPRPPPPRAGIRHPGAAAAVEPAGGDSGAARPPLPAAPARGHGGAGAPDAAPAPLAAARPAGPASWPTPATRSAISCQYARISFVVRGCYSDRSAAAPAADHPVKASSTSFRSPVMSQYKNLLLAVDLSEESDLITERASAIATAHGATLHIVHDIEPLSFAYGGDIPMDFSGIQDEIQRQAEQQLADHAERLGIPQERRHLLLGRPASEIHALVNDLAIDLVVLGSHGRSGFARLLGSTANAVLQGSPCDVLAVRVGKKK